MYKLITDSDGNITALECWGASTKHPDSVYRYKDFELPACTDPQHPLVIFQWLVSCSSRFTYVGHTLEMLKWAYNWLIDSMVQYRSLRGEVCTRESIIKSLDIMSLG